MNIVSIILIVLILIITALLVCDHLFYSSFLRRAEQIRNEAGIFDDKKINDNDVATLPIPVARFIIFSGLKGNKRISSVHIKHSGLFRPQAGRDFTPIKGEYFLTTRRPSFCWFGRISIMPLITVSAFDSYFNGNGRMLIKLLSFFKIADARSPETSLSALGRCIAEMSMAPSFFMNSEQIQWKAFNNEHATCVVNDAGLKVNAALNFNHDGSLERIEIDRLFDRGKGQFTTEKFTGKCSVVKEFNGLKMASVVDGYWNLEDGDLHYVHFIIDEIEIQ
ncbi:MAG TPA: DUF6544 family protein [Bacteroidales bacterium]|nr:DUF6544 family protein [Bacteroidales bacterium]